MSAPDLAGIDLLALTGRDTALRKSAGTHGGEYVGACPECGGRDRFHVWPAAARPRYWCRGCGASGDAIAYVRWRSGCSFAEACEQLGRPLDRRPLPGRRRPARRPMRLPAADDVDEPPALWRRRAERFVETAVSTLWSDRGRRARQWLDSRGLADATIRRWRLGYQPADTYEPPAAWGLDGRRIWLPRGIVVPWHLAGQLCEVKLRRPIGQPKYMRVRGGRPVLFGAGTLAGHDVALIAEGELDVILADQLVGDLVGVATLGSASQPLGGRAAACLLGVRLVLVALDADAAGQRGADRIGDLSGRMRRLHLPVAGDLTDLVRLGGDLRAWLSFELERVDPLRSWRRRAIDSSAPPVRADESTDENAFDGAEMVDMEVLGDDAG